MSSNTTTNQSADGQPSKVSGQYHSLKGTIVESIGDLTGAKSWQDSGKQEHAQGEAEYNAAQAVAYVEGTTDRIEGKKDSIVGAVMGDKNQQAQGNLKEQQGKTKQDMNKFT